MDKIITQGIDMNAISKGALEKESFFSFLNSSLNKDFEAYPLAGDASARRYYRIVEGQESYVLMVWEPFKDNSDYPFLSVLKHFENHKVGLPKVIAKSPKEGLILLEDLGDLTLERKFWESQDQRLVIDFYKATIDQLLLIHHPCTQDKTPSCTAFNVSFDTDKFLWEMNYAKEHLLHKLNSLNFDTAQTNYLKSCFVDICQRLSSQNQVICHRDFHSRNVMIKLGKVKLIDFQDARLGPIQYDLVSLLRDSYVNINPDTELELLYYYIEERKKYNGESIDMDEFLKIYELQSIQRCFKACGSFASFYNQRQDVRYLKYLKQTLKQVKTSLEKFPEYNDFLKILEDSGTFDKKYESE